MTKYIKKVGILFVILSLSLFACKSKSSNSNNIDSKDIGKIDPAPFDVDSAYRFIAYQLSFGSRTPNSEAHKDCMEWIIKKLQSWGYDVTTQQFNSVDYFGNKVKGYNIILNINPNVKNRVVLMAHWDSRQVADQDPVQENRSKPILAADDGASGVAVILEIARQVYLNKEIYNNIGIDIVFVDMEDVGHDSDDGSSESNWCQGSRYWASQIKHSVDKPSYGILLDMVGAKDAKFYLEQYSKVYASRYQNMLWDTAYKLGYNNYFFKQNGGTITDDHVEVIKTGNIPMVDIINFDPNTQNGFGKHWHTQGDNMNIIDKNTLKAVGETIFTTIINS